MGIQFDLADAIGRRPSRRRPAQCRPSPDLAPLPVTRAEPIGYLVRMMQGTGASMLQLLGEAGLPEVPVGPGQDLVPVAAACALLDIAACRAGVGEIGLALAKAGGLGMLGAFGRHVQAADSLLEAIARFGRHAAWNLLGAETNLQVAGPSAIWCCSPSPAATSGRHHSAIFALTQMRNVVRLAAGPDWRADELRLPRAAGDVELPLAQALGERVLPGMAYALVFPRALLRRPIVVPHPRSVEDGGAELAILADALPTDFVGSVRQILRAFLPAGYPHLRDFARACGLSVRKLQRRLNASGTTYSKLVEQIRLEEAMAMLADRRITVTEVGLELGYNESASFTRAFRRWQGLAPRDYRLITSGPAVAPQLAKLAGTN
jgi:AraC-like DNA-binding protein